MHKHAGELTKVEIVALHCLATLPDDIAKRRELLECVLSLLPRKSEVWDAARIILQHLESHERAISEVLL